MRVRILFFFFQAEDGIRYLIVTGVQTCALPISIRYSNRSENCIVPGLELSIAPFDPVELCFPESSVGVVFGITQQLFLGQPFRERGQRLKGSLRRLDLKRNRV